MKDKILDFATKNKKWFFVTEAISLLLFFWGIFFVDQNWWWMLLAILPLFSLLLRLYKDEIDTNAFLRNRVRYTLGGMTFVSVVVVLFAVFITPWWFFGFLIPAFFGFLWGVFSVEKENPLPQETKLRLSVLIGIVFLLLFSLFCIPSYAANIHKNPEENFPSTFYSVNSYNLYGSIGNRDHEHVIPQSWFPTDENFVNDFVNVIWSNETANNYRGNLEFGMVPETSENAIYSDDVVVGYRDHDHFMPTDEYKGDVAGIVLYMYVTYKNDGFPKGKINLSLMKTWSRQDPVDHREEVRNDSILSIYGYSNRFVEHPWLVGFVV